MTDAVLITFARLGMNMRDKGNDKQAQQAEIVYLRCSQKRKPLISLVGMLRCRVLHH